MTVSREGELPVRRRLPRTLAVLGVQDLTAEYEAE